MNRNPGPVRANGMDSRQRSSNGNCWRDVRRTGTPFSDAGLNFHVAMARMQASANSGRVADSTRGWTTLPCSSTVKTSVALPVTPAANSVGG